MLKEHLSIATRRFASPSRRTATVLLAGSPTKKSRPSSMISERGYTRSKVLAAPDVLELDEDEEIEILGPFPNTSEREVKGKLELKVKRRGDRKRIHPLFNGVADACPSDKATSTTKTRTKVVRIDSASTPAYTKENIEPIKEIPTIPGTATIVKNKLDLDLDMNMNIPIHLDSTYKMHLGNPDRLHNSSEFTKGPKYLDPDCVPAPHSTTSLTSTKSTMPPVKGQWQHKTCSLMHWIL
ncbi:hypothetical protein BDQ17DRAFT_803121 [Cyathus striatus]|nr:hypothetical protein BDQ17DRAFT_803121 [Cyathus striatus]